MELKESKRVVDTIVEMLDKEVARQFPMAARMIPNEIKMIFREALLGAYASGFNHGVIETKEAYDGSAK